MLTGHKEGGAALQWEITRNATKKLEHTSRVDGESSKNMTVQRQVDGGESSFEHLELATNKDRKLFIILPYSKRNGYHKEEYMAVKILRGVMYDKSIDGIQRKYR